MIKAEVVLDSVGPEGHRLTTLIVDFHRFILAELNTHCALVKNSASSRAIPLPKRIQAVREDTAMPLHWGRNQSGMSAEEELTGEELRIAKQSWLDAASDAADQAEIMAGIGLHKQVAARVLEPFLWHRAILTGTDWDGFFFQRCSKSAQPEMEALANAIRDAYQASEPLEVPKGGWHTPLITRNDEANHNSEQLRMISVARCARVSFLNERGIRDTKEDLALYWRLYDGVHLSPFEHVATPHSRVRPGHRGRLKGWQQLRHYLELDEKLMGITS